MPVVVVVSEVAVTLVVVVSVVWVVAVVLVAVVCCIVQMALAVSSHSRKGRVEHADELVFRLMMVNKEEPKTQDS